MFKKLEWVRLKSSDWLEIINTFHNTAEIQVKCHPDLWLCPVFLLPHQSPSSSPPPPPRSSSSFRPRSTSHPFPPSRFSSDLVSHYLSEIKTTVPRIPQNLRGLRRGVRQEVVLKCVWLREADMRFFFLILFSSTGCLLFLENSINYIELSQTQDIMFIQKGSDVIKVAYFNLITIY